MALKQNLGVHVSDPNKLKRIAERLGYKQTRGPDKGRGSVRQLLEAIIAGELMITPKRATKHAGPSSDERRKRVLDELQSRGAISHRATDPGAWSPGAPIQVEGEPVSEMLIRERR